MGFKPLGGLSSFKPFKSGHSAKQSSANLKGGSFIRKGSFIHPKKHKKSKG